MTVELSLEAVVMGDDEEAADEQQSLPQEQQQQQQQVNSSSSASSSSTSNGSEIAPETDMINSRPASNQNEPEEDPSMDQDSGLSPAAPNSSRSPSVASPTASNSNTFRAETTDHNPFPSEKVEIKIEPGLLDDNQHRSPDGVGKDENSKSPRLSAAQIPMLRLNIALASDPAANPDAKDLTNITAANDSQFEKSIEPDFVGAAPPPQPVIRKANKPDITIPINVDLPPRIPMFMCGPCGIRFSSASTLEAHQTYYCSHRKDADENSGGGKNANSNDPNCSEPPAKAAKTGKQYACTQCSYSADKKVSLNRHMRMHQSSPAPSSNTSNGDDSTASQQLQLQFQAQAAAAAAAAAAVLQQQQQQQQPPQVDRYCSDCDIRFSSTKTYRAHKQHYCSSRHRDGQSNNSTPKPPQKSGSQSPPDVPKTPPVAPQQPFLALPTNPIIVIPYSLIRGASVIPGLLSTLAPGISNPESACFFFQNGTLQPIAVSLASATAAAAAAAAAAATVAANAVTSQQPQPSQAPSHGHHGNSQANSGSSSSQSRVQTPNVGSDNSSNSTGEVLKAVNKRENVKESSTPLDLSVRRLSPGGNLRERSLSLSSAISVDQLRMDFDSLMEGKENLSVSGDSITPEQIVCAPSLPGSPPLTPSPKRRSNSPRGGGGGSGGSVTGSRSDRDGSVSISPLTLQQQQQQQLLMRPLLPADIALRLSAGDPALNLNLNILPHSQLLTKQGVELAFRLSSTVNSNNVDHMPNKNHPQPQMSPLLNSISPTNNVQVPVLSSTPQIFVKQGDSKCKECNIVFCKYENYLAHKKHYCSARNLDGDGDSSKASPPISPQAASPSNTSGSANPSGTQRPHTGPGQAMAYQQLICAACGIKFTSLDNLTAHQMYYCPKRVDVQMPTNVTPQKERCSKCKSMHEPGQPCTVAGQGAYKCPICEAISPNSTEARRHMDTHGGVKAFRCTICRYKGNTLRGMRTHIRMHFDKKSNDFNEENYITCILEEDGIEIPPAAAVASAAAAAAQLMNQAAAVAQAASQSQQPPLPPPPLIGDNKLNQATHGAGQMTFCELCPYYSAYKMNVAKHIKFVHSRERPPSNSPLIGEGGESLIFNGDSGNSTPRPPVSSTPGPTTNSVIKTEPEDDRPEDADVDVDVVMEEPEVIIKTEASDLTGPGTMASPPPPALVANQTQQVKQKSLVKNSPNHQQQTKTPSPPSFLGEINHSGPNYCAPCDITFNYVNTYIAHKKFYCKNIQQDGGTSVGGAPASIRAATSGSPNSVLAVTRATETSV
ncbi:zinc finger protein ush isoform X2 [Malaya genurostris]|uniref:zinc finger protein ush isoform X2 n=1 Tax=Malaya genurostris TaxID=325434 RepID=UPI0026F407E9|nr:zinc finger protein ush isoform X2 [Malaya genurostris]